MLKRSPALIVPCVKAVEASALGLRCGGFGGGLVGGLFSSSFAVGGGGEGGEAGEE